MSSGRWPQRMGVNVVLSDVPRGGSPSRRRSRCPAPGGRRARRDPRGTGACARAERSGGAGDARGQAAGDRPDSYGKEISDPPPLGLVTQIVPLDYVRAEEAVQLLTKSRSKTRAHRGRAAIERGARSRTAASTSRGISICIRPVDVKTGGEAGLSTYVYAAQARERRRAGDDTLGQVFGATWRAAAPRQRVQALEGKGLSSCAREHAAARECNRCSQRLASDAGATTPHRVERSGAGGFGADGGFAEVRARRRHDDRARIRRRTALVIRTAPPNFSVLQETIDRLDVRPPQVLLEVLIAGDQPRQEHVVRDQLATRTRTRDLQRRQHARRARRLRCPELLGDSALTSLGGLGMRVVSLAPSTCAALLQAVAAHTNVRVLSAPRVLALNNEQARILVGSEVPFTSATHQRHHVIGRSGRRSIAMSARNSRSCRPMNNDGYVTLRLLQEVSELSTSTVAAAQNAPIITTREAETSAIVKSGRHGRDRRTDRRTAERHRERHPDPQGHSADRWRCSRARARSTSARASSRFS